MAEQLSLFEGDREKKDRKAIELPTGEKILTNLEIEILQSLLTIRFIVEKPNGVKVEKIFKFDLDQPQKTPRIESRIVFAPEGLRVFDSSISSQEHSDVSSICWQKIKKQAYAIFKDKLRNYQQNKK
jgi:hypothetical protein